jgi:hypothetical protein
LSKLNLHYQIGQEDANLLQLLQVQEEQLLILQQSGKPLPKSVLQPHPAPSAPRH